MMRKVFHVMAMAAIGGLAVSCNQKKPPQTQPAAQPSNKLATTPHEEKTLPGGTVELFDGKTLNGWKPADFAGHAEPKVKDGAIILPAGITLTGVTYAKKPPFLINYEISLQAKRLDGNDFFCGLTFPFNDSAASLILGGWGGGLCGISSIDFQDAANNNTTKIMSFEDNRWYSVRMRVTNDRLQAWLDDEQIIDADITGKKITVRGDIDQSVPLGIASYQTSSAIRDIRMRPLTAAEIAEKRPE